MGHILADAEVAVKVVVDQSSVLSDFKLLRANVARETGQMNKLFSSMTGPQLGNASAFDFLKAGNIAAKETASSINLAASSLPRLRYALYDVATTAGATGAALTALSVGAVTTAASFESAFTGVERSAQLSGDSINQVKDALIAVTRDVPKSFEEIAGIASLGAQMGIAADDLAAFSEVVSKFAATTNVSTEQSAMAFGKLGQLLGLNASEYENLASSIAYVGDETNATETQIIAVAEAIGGVAAQAGFSTEYVVGLSASLASLGVPAEQSRGALTRTFQEVARAAAEGGGILDEYANILGVSTTEAKRLADTDMQGFFDQLVVGLSTVPAEDFTKTLDTLNLSDIRVTNTLARLAENAEFSGDAIAKAGTSYREGTYLNISFATTVDDLASKFKFLQNALAEFGNSIGSGFIGPVGLAIDIITNLVQGLTEMSKNPFMAWIPVVVTGLGALAGAALTAVAAVVAFGGGLLATRTALEELAKSGLGANNAIIRMIGGMVGVDMGAKKASTSVRGLAAANTAAAMTERQSAAAKTLSALADTKAATGNKMVVASLSARLAMTRANIAAMSTMQKMQALAGPIGIALTVVSALALAWDAVAEAAAEANKTSADYATDYFGDLSTLSEALAKDAAAGVGQQITLPVADTSEYAGNLDSAAAAQKNLNGAVDDTSAAIEAQTATYGPNSEAALRNILNTSEAFRELLGSGIIEDLGGNSADFVNAIIGDPEEGAQKYVDGLVGNLEAKLKAAGGLLKNADLSSLLGAWGDSAMTDEALVTGFADALGMTREEARALIEQLIGLQAGADAASGTIAAAGVDAGVTADIMGDLGDQVDNTAGTFDTFKEKVDNAIGGETFNLDAMNAFGASLTALTDGFAQNGTSFDQMTSNGLSNLSNLRQALYDSVAAAESMGLSAVAGVGMVFAQLQQQGVETAQILSTLTAMGGAYAQYAGVIQEATAGTYTGLTSAYNAMQQGVKKAGGAAEGAAQKVRTLLDYANDLSSVWKRAFDIRFSSQSALDDITKGWLDMAGAIDDAKKQIDDLQVTIGELTADKALKEYFLSIAEAYGDTLRAAKLRAEIAAIDSDIASNSSNLASAQDEANKTLIGNTTAAIKNRKTILGIVQSYQSYIGTLAASGASQETLAAATAQARSDFMAQATQLGYNSTELGTYAAAFNDVSTAISNVPRNITVDADTDPALQALNELNAKAAAATASRTMQVGASIDYSAMQKFARGAKLMSMISNYDAEITAAQNSNMSPAAKKLYISQLTNGKNSLAQQLESGDFYSGGYTGAGGKYDVAGVVHRGEYVVPKNQVDQSTGLPYFMMQSPKFFSGGATTGSVANSSNVVALSAGSIQAIARAVQPMLFLDGQKISDASSAAYSNNTKVGAF